MSKIYCSDSYEFMKNQKDFDFDIIYADVPYGLGSEIIIKSDGKVDYAKATDFMDKWNMPTGDYWEKWFNQAYRTLKHGGYCILFGIDRVTLMFKYYAHLAGFEEHQSLYWYFISSFPKASDLSKNIDKHFGEERNVIGIDKDKLRPNRKSEKQGGTRVLAGGLKSDNGATITEASHPIAKKYDGYKYSIAPLKQTCETIMVFHKPYKSGSCLHDTLAMERDGDGTCACGALNIDGGRVPILSGEKNPTGSAKRVFDSNQYTDEKKYGDNKETSNLGRYPSQTFIDSNTAEFLDKQKPDVKGGSINKGTPQGFGDENSLYGNGFHYNEFNAYDDTGGCSKILHKCDYEDGEYDLYMYCPKVSKKERDGGLNTNVKNNHPCLLPGSLVICKSGVKRIEDISYDDMVLTECGKFSNIDYISKHDVNEYIYEIKVSGVGISIKATNNHPFLIARPIKDRNDIKNLNISWIEGKDLAVGDYTLTPIVNEVEETINMSSEFWYILGFWLAEGSFLRAGHGNHIYPVFSTNYTAEEPYKIKSILTKLSSRKISIYKNGTVIVFDYKLGELIKKMTESYSKNKQLKEFFWKLPLENLQEIFKGYIDGDGCRVRNYLQSKTISLQLAFQMKFIAEKLGYSVEISIEKPNNLKSYGIGDRVFKKTSLAYHCRFYNKNQSIKRKPSKPIFIKYNGLTYSLKRIKQINKIYYEGDVINLSVKDSPTFQTCIGMSHNTLKPIALNERILKLFKTPNNQKICYPFAGVFSEVIAGHKVGFTDFVGCEIDEDYINIGEARFKHWTNKDITKKCVKEVKIEKEENNIVKDGQKYLF